MQTNIIKNGRITEKSSMLGEQNVYTFNIDNKANKTEVAKAIFALYKVKPVKVNITTIKSKKVFSRGIVGKKSGGKKAVVFLKKGDKIEII